MALRLHKITNDSGIVMVVILIIIMVMALVSATIFSQSMSQTKTSRAQVDQIVAEEFAKGAFWTAYNQALSNGSISYPFYYPGPLSTNLLTFSVNNRTYSAQVTISTLTSSATPNVVVTSNY